MFAYIFLIITSLMIVKPVRSSLFLTEFGVERLPYVYILVAVTASLVAWLYATLTRTIRFNYLVVYTILISIASLLLFWFLFHSGHQAGWLFYAFYTWVAIFGVITSAQFWLMANLIFNVREAKRLFGFIGAGAISGGICGGYLTNYLAPLLKTENLLFFSIAFLALCVGIFWQIWTRGARDGYREVSRRKGKPIPIDQTGNPVKLIVRSRYLASISGIIGLSIIVANLVDYQFSAIASRAITDTDKLTAFFGFWMSTLSFVSLGVQLILTGRIIKHFGVATSLVFLPAGVVLGSIAVLLFPGIGSAIMIRVCEGGFKHSINKAGIELLSLPIPAHIKRRVKSFLDVFIDNLATGLSGILLIFLTVVLSFSVSHISLITIGIVAGWTYLIFSVRVEYVNAFRAAIEKRSIDPAEQSLNLEDASVFKSLLKALEGKSDRQILYALNLIEGIENRALLPHFERLIGHPSDEVKARVLELARRFEELDLSAAAEELAQSDDETVRTQAIRYLCERSDDMLAVFGNYREHADYRVRSSALMCAARAWSEKESVRTTIDLSTLLEETLKSADTPVDDEENSYVRMTVARAIGVAGNADLYPRLTSLLSDEDMEVVRAAIISSGQARSPELIPALIRHLGTPRVRQQARQSLAHYGTDVVDALVQHMDGSDVRIYIRRRVPRVLALIGSQSATDALMKNLGHPDLHVRYEVLKALNKIKSRFSHIKYDLSVVEDRLLNETEQYRHYSTILYIQNKSRSTGVPDKSRAEDEEREEVAWKLLTRTLRERLDDCLERIFRLLGLIYVPDDMYHAFLGVTSGKAPLRADAIEFLDNVLDARLKRVIIPIVERSSGSPPRGSGRRPHSMDDLAKEEGITSLLKGEDNWLKACALYYIAESGGTLHRDVVRDLSGDADPVVRETSEYCLERIAVSG